MNLLIISLTLIVIVLFLYAMKSRKEKVNSRFLSRTDFPFDELYEKYFSEDFPDKVLTKELLEHVAGSLNISVGVLRPEDSFKKELKEEKGWEFDSSIQMLFIEIEKLAKEKDIDLMGKQINTLKDYLQTMVLIY